MSVPIRLRIDRTFEDEAVAKYGDEYLKVIQENRREVERVFRRTMLLLFLLLVAFILLTQASIREVSLGPFKLGDYTLLNILFPIAVAYTFSEVITLVIMRQNYQYVHDLVLWKLYGNKLIDDGLESFLSPPSIYTSTDLVTTELEISERFGSRRVRIFAQVIRYWTIPLSVFLFVAPVTFEIYAFYTIFTAYGATNILAWVSLAVSVYLLFIALAAWTADAWGSAA